MCLSVIIHIFSLDDKQSISAGEPNAAVASLNRGRRVLTLSGRVLTPSVALAIDSPDEYHH